jgi:hypothetical protein
MVDNGRTPDLQAAASCASEISALVSDLRVRYEACELRVALADALAEELRQELECRSLRTVDAWLTIDRVRRVAFADHAPAAPRSGLVLRIRFWLRVLALRGPR